MNSNLINSVGVGLLFAMAVWGTICLLMTVIEYLQQCLSARKNINTEVPKLAASVEVPPVKPASVASGPSVSAGRKS